jgi:hypothetical protein
VPAFAIKTKEMIAICIGFADPQFADHAAVGQRLVHVNSPLAGSAVRRRRRIALQRHI